MKKPTLAQTKCQRQAVNSEEAVEVKKIAVIFFDFSGFGLISGDSFGKESKNAAV